MSASTTRVFGLKIGIDPKILVGGLVAMAAALFWYNSHSDDASSVPSRPSAAVRTDVPSFTPPAAATTKARVSTSRRSTNQFANDRGTLRLRPVDATRGDIDPTLHLDLLSRLQAVEQTPSTRSLFEIGVVPPPPSSAPPIKGPVILPKPLPGPAPGAVAATPPPPPSVNIPLRYYGFVRPAETGRTNSGLFLDGDNVLVVAEGQVVKQRFLVVELTPTSARMEDVQLRQGQTLPVTPVANP